MRLFSNVLFISFFAGLCFSLNQVVREMNFAGCVNVALKKIGFKVGIDYDGDLNQLDSTNTFSLSLSKRTHIEVKGEQSCKTQLLDPFTNALEMGALVSLLLCTAIFLINSLQKANKKNEVSEELVSNTGDPQITEEPEDDDTRLLRMM